MTSTLESGTGCMERDVEVETETEAEGQEADRPILAVVSSESVAWGDKEFIIEFATSAITAPLPPGAIRLVQFDGPGEFRLIPLAPLLR